MTKVRSLGKICAKVTEESYQGPSSIYSPLRNIVFEVFVPLRNIAHVMSTCNFDQSSICVFVYLYLYICTSHTRGHVFACQTLRNIHLEILVPLSFQKYSTCHIYQHFLAKTVFVYMCICVFVFVYLAIQDSP